MTGPDEKNDRGRQSGGGERDLSDLAASYRTAGPYMAASTRLVAAVGIFTALGWWGDEKLSHRVPWMLLLGAAVGMVGGFVSFFRTVLGKRKP
jgi:ATP synthase protein I